MRSVIREASATDLDTTRWAVVVPSFNQPGDAINCIESPRAAVRRPRSVIVGDDASTDAAGASIDPGAYGDEWRRGVAGSRARRAGGWWFGGGCRAGGRGPLGSSEEHVRGVAGGGIAAVAFD